MALGPDRPSKVDWFLVINATPREEGALLLPTCRQRPLQPLQHQRLVRPSPEDRLNDVRRQQRQAESPAERGHQRVARRLPLGLLPDGKGQFLVPPVGILRETGTLYPYDAEALAGGRLHHHPALQVVHHLGA